MGERMQCPVCQRYVSVTAGGSLRMHRAAAGPAKCEASSVLPATARETAAKSKPFRPMLGGVTGDDVPEPDGDWPIYLDSGIGYLRPDVDRYDPERPDSAKLLDGTTIELCTADDARGPERDR